MRNSSSVRLKWLVADPSRPTRSVFVLLTIRSVPTRVWLTWTASTKRVKWVVLYRLATWCHFRSVRALGLVTFRAWLLLYTTACGCLLAGDHRISYTPPFRATTLSTPSYALEFTQYSMVKLPLRFVSSESLPLMVTLILSTEPFILKQLPSMQLLFVIPKPSIVPLLRKPE